MSSSCRLVPVSATATPKPFQCRASHSESQGQQTLLPVGFYGTSLIHVWIQTVTFLLCLRVCRWVNDSLCNRLVLGGDANAQ